MRPWQNKLAIFAGFLVAGALFPWSFRLVCAFAAIVIVMLLLVMRLRTHAAVKTRLSGRKRTIRGKRSA
jgi:hypothetical protein